MEYKLTKLPTSAYEINVVYTKDEVKDLNEKVANSLMEHNIKIEDDDYEDYYTTIYPEVACRVWMEDLSEDNDVFKLNFIGEVYDVKIDKLANGGESITFRLDVYPDTNFQNNDWLDIKIKPVEPLTEEELQKKYNLELENLCYSKSEKAEVITKGCAFRALVRHFYKDDEAVYSGTFSCKGNFSNKEPEFFEYVLENFVGRKIGERFEISYDKLAKELKIDDPKLVKIEFVIDKIAKKLFKLNDQTISKLDFPAEEIKTMADLEKSLKEYVEYKHFKQELSDHIDEYITNVKAESMDVVIPNTLITEEFESRLEQLSKKLDKAFGAGAFDEYKHSGQLDKIIEETYESSQESLAKSYVFQNICEHFGIDWKDKDLNHEQLLYDKLCAMN